MNYKSSMTDVGNEMIAQAHKDDKAIIFDSFLVSEALPENNADLTKVTTDLFSNPLTYPINSKATLDNTFTVKAVLANKTDKFSIDKDFSINTIGILAHIDGDTDSRVMTVAAADGIGAVITAFKDTLYSLTIAITQAYKADQPVKFVLANVAYALASDLDKLDISINARLTNYYTKPEADDKFVTNEGLASKLPTDIAHTGAANTFTEEQRFAKGATDGDGNSFATEKDVKTETTGVIRTTDNYGAGNLILNSGNMENYSGWTIGGSGTSDSTKFHIYVSPHDFYKGGKANLIQINNKNVFSAGSASEVFLLSNSFAVTAGKAISYSFLGFASENVVHEDVYFIGYKADGTQVPILLQQSIKLSYTRLDKRSGTFTVPNGVVTGQVRFDNNGSTDGKDSGFYFTELKVAEESVPSPWMPSPNDSDTWQKTKITADDGGASLRIMASDKTDLNKTLLSLPPGVHTLYVQMGTVNNPSSDSIRGVVNKSELAFGNGIFMSNSGGGYSMWKVIIQNGTDVVWKQVPAMEDITPSSMHGRDLTGNDDIFTLAAGLYPMAGVTPKNGIPGVTWGWVQVVDNGNKFVRWFDVNGREQINTYLGSPAHWSGWRATNSSIVASGTDLNTLMLSGTYMLNGITVTNLPSGLTGNQWLTLYVNQIAGSNGTQLLINSNTGQMWTRGWHASGSIIFTAWVESVMGNSNGTITVNGQTYTPANNAYAVLRNDAGTIVGPVKPLDGNLQSPSGGKYYPIVWFANEAAARAGSIANPNIDARW